MTQPDLNWNDASHDAPEVRVPQKRSRGALFWLLLLGGIGGAGLLVCGGLIAVAVIFGDKLLHPYGQRIELKNGSELFYTKAVTEGEAKRLADWLQKEENSGWDPKGEKKSYQLNKSGGTYEFRFPIKDNVELSAVEETGLQVVSWILAKQVFDKARVDVHVCDSSFKTKKVVSSNLIELKNGNGLVYTPAVTEAEARRLANWLQNEGGATWDVKGVETVYLLNKSGDTYEVRFTLKENVEVQPFQENLWTFQAQLMSSQVFNNARVEIHACDSMYKTKKVIPGRT
jgi:hypothetical protein